MKSKEILEEGIFSDFEKAAKNIHQAYKGRSNATKGMGNRLRSFFSTDRKKYNRSVQDQVAAKKFIDKFINQAYETLNVAIENDLIDINSNDLGVSNTVPAAQQPQQTIQPSTANINMKFQGQPTDIKSANLASQIPTSPTTTSTGTDTTQKPIQARQTMAQKTQAQLQRQAAKKALGGRKQPIKEDTYTKLNLLFETIVSRLYEQEPQQPTQKPQTEEQKISISKYFKEQFLDNFLQGINMTPAQAKINALLKNLPDLYQSGQLKKELHNLANIAWTLAKK